MPLTIALVSTGQPWQRVRSALSRFDRAGSVWASVRQVVAVLVGVVLLLLGLSQAVPTWRAANEDGVAGELTITYIDCAGKGPCSHIGTFRSNDGRITLTDVELIGDEGEIGDHVPAFFEGDRDQVYGHGWSGLMESVLMAGGGAAFVGGGAMSVMEAVALRRRPSTGRHARRV